MLRNGDGGRWVVLSERYGEPGETIRYDQSAVWIPDATVSAGEFGKLMAEVTTMEWKRIEENGFTLLVLDVPAEFRLYSFGEDVGGTVSADTYSLRQSGDTVMPPIRLPQPGFPTVDDDGSHR